jgi:hypothetical protein
MEENLKSITMVQLYRLSKNMRTSDSTLTLNTDFDRVYNRASSRKRLLQNVRNYLNTDAATKIYTMMILPIVTIIIIII